MTAELNRIATMRAKSAKTSTKAARGATSTEQQQAAHVKVECALRDHPALGRWVKQTSTDG